MAIDSVFLNGVLEGWIICFYRGYSLLNFKNSFLVLQQHNNNSCDVCFNKDNYDDEISSQVERNHV